MKIAFRLVYDKDIKESFTMKNHSKITHLFPLVLLFAMAGCSGKTTPSSEIQSSDGISSSQEILSSSEAASSEGTSVSIHVHAYESVVTEPTCTEGGFTTHTCACGDSYVDGEVPAKGHTLVKTDAVVPNCTDGGRAEYYTCSDCGKHFADNAGTNEISDLTTLDLAALGHQLDHVESVAPTATAPGVVEHYHCAYCDQYYADENGETEIDGDSVHLLRGKLITLEDRAEDIGGALTQEGNAIVSDGSTQATSFIFGDQDLNTEIVLEFDLTIDEWTSGEWSLFSIQYRRWDGNTTYELEISRDRILSKKITYSDSADNHRSEEVLATITDFTIEAGQSYHVKVLCSGWTKTILIDDVRIVSIVESDYCVGRFGITTWEYTRYTISDLYYRDYQQNAADLQAEFPEVFE